MIEGTLGYVVIFLVAHLVICVLVAIAAHDNGESFVGYFLMTFCFGPLVSGFFLWRASFMRCPDCAKSIKRIARVCPWCRRSFIAASDPTDG